MALAPGDYPNAEITHWLHSADINVTAGTPESRKKPLENRVWYMYPGTVNFGTEGSMPLPSKVMRILDDGTTQTFAYEYNQSGKPTKVTDPVGRETVYVYGEANVPDANATTGSGTDLLEVKQKNGATYDTLSSNTYDASHRVLTTTEAAGQVSTFTYDSQGRIATSVTPPHSSFTAAQRTTTYTYYPDASCPSTGGSAGRPCRVDGPLSSSTTMQYDTTGRLWKTTDDDGYVVATTYDTLDRPTRVDYPDGSYEQTVYDKLDAQDFRDRAGRWSHVFHDALKRPVVTRDALGRTTIQHWCSCGSLDSITDPNGNTTTWGRDLQGRVTKETRQDGTFSTNTYENTTSRLWKRTDRRSAMTEYKYKVDDQLWQILYPSIADWTGGSAIVTPNVTFTYSSVYPRVTQVQDGTGTTTYAYHGATGLGAGRLSTITSLGGSHVVGYTYDELGRTKVRTVNTRTATSTWDELGRLTRLAYPVGNFDFTYDSSSSRRASLTYPNGQSSSYAYFGNADDHRLQTLHHKKPDGTTTLSRFDYTYDVMGNIKTWQQRRLQPDNVTVEDFTLGLGYDAADQLTSGLRSWTAGTDTSVPRSYAYDYDPAGNRSAEQRDTEVTTSTFYGVQNPGGTPPSGEAYPPNALQQQAAGGAIRFAGTVNEPATVTVSSGSTSVAADTSQAGSTTPFDAALSLPSAQASTVTVKAKDGPPSCTPGVDCNETTQSYSVTPSAAAGGPFTYDKNGNLLSDGTRKLTWDAENRLVTVKNTSNAVLGAYTYDWSGRRSTRTAAGVTHTYAYDGEDIVEDRLTGGAVTMVSHGPGIDEPWASHVGTGSATYFVADHLGSVSQTTTSAGSVATVVKYDPYGRPAGSVAQYAYTGREWDAETGLYYYRARYYDPKLGRFLSEDSIGFAGGDVNLYGYVWNNPANLVDPLGLCAMAPNSPQCFAQVKYRPAVPSNPKSTMTHTFWYVQASSGAQFVVTGGPNGPVPHLNVWPIPTGPGDPQLKWPTSWNSGMSPVFCDPVEKLLSMANTWPQSRIQYNYQGPNSNTVTHLLGNIAGFNPSAPPGSMGW
jgi:RHS repeat-associated protein